MSLFSLQTSLLLCLSVSLCALLTPSSASQTEFLNSNAAAQENPSKSTTPICDVYFKEQKTKPNFIETTVLNTLECFESDPLPHSVWVGLSEMLSQAFIPS